MDTVSNGGFLPFSAGGIISPLPGELGRQYGPCDYDVRHNLTAQYVYQLPVQTRNRMLGYAVNGWQVSGTAFWQSGIPFSVLSAPYTTNGNGIVQGGGPQYASVVSGAPQYIHRCEELPVWQSRQKLIARSRLRLERFLPYEVVCAA